MKKRSVFSEPENHVTHPYKIEVWECDGRRNLMVGRALFVTAFEAANYGIGLADGGGNLEPQPTKVGDYSFA